MGAGEPIRLTTDCFFGGRYSGGGPVYNVHLTADRLFENEEVQPLIIVSLDMDRRPPRAPLTRFLPVAGDYIVQDIIPFVDTTYRTVSDRQGRMIAGHSDGGTGAVSIGFSHPEAFSFVGSYDGLGFVDLTQILASPGSHDQEQFPLQFWILGMTSGNGVRSGTVGGRFAAALEAANLPHFTVEHSGTHGQVAKGIEESIVFFSESLLLFDVEVITPQKASIDGGDPITIEGREFPPDVVVTIGGSPLTNLQTTDNRISGLVPSGKGGERELLITIPSQPSSTFRTKFVYISPTPPAITAITPDSVPASGGQTVMVDGSGFQPGAKVFLGGGSISGLVITPDRITFTVPPGDVGAREVVVENADGKSDRLPDGFTYTLAPTIEKAEPDEGPLTGGTEITVTGSDFMDGAVVIIGETEVTPDSVTPNQLRLKTPPGSDDGWIDMRVINPDGGFVVLEEAFFYNPPPTIIFIQPVGGALAGGTEVTITGRNFFPKPKVTIGGVEAEVVSARGSVIVVKAPANTEGRKDVVVTNTDGQQTTRTGGFTYDPSFAVEAQEKLATTLGAVKQTALLQNFPNPTNPETWIPYALAEAASVTVRIYNTHGELVRTLDVGKQPAGVYLTREKAVYWNGRDDVGQSVASGVYFYQLRAGEFERTRRMLLVK